MGFGHRGVIKCPDDRIVEIVEIVERAPGGPGRARDEGGATAVPR
ncbi:hypothetical protein [Actinomyces capricornis]|nr:hypothetical protein [Actinomyces capricornis]